MSVHSGNPRAFGVDTFSGETLGFDSVDRCFAKLAATGFVGFIAVVVWMWLS